MVSERVVGVECGSGMNTPPRLCYNALPSSQRAAVPLGLATPPLQAPGSVPFQWEVAPGKPRGEPQIRSRPVSARRLEPPPRMAPLLSSTTPSTAWQVAKVAGGEVASKTVLGGPYYVLLRAPPSLFDGPSVVSRSNSLSRASFGRRHPVVCRDEGIMRRKERAPAAWFWKRAVGRRRDGVSSKKDDVVDAAAVAQDGEAALTVDARGGGSCGNEKEANVRITRFRRRNGSHPNLSAAGNHLWANIYEGLKQVVTAPWRSRTRKSASRR